MSASLSLLSYLQATVRALKAKRASRRRGPDNRTSKSQRQPHRQSQSPPTPHSDDAVINSTALIDDKNVPPQAAGVDVLVVSAEDGGDENGTVSRARKSADAAEELARGMRRGLALRDDVVASTEAGNVYRGEAFRGREYQCRFYRRKIFSSISVRSMDAIMYGVLLILL